MKLRMLVTLEGTHDDLPWPPAGGIVEIAHPGVVADMVRNGRWLLPRDTLNQEATKPPLYNWLSALPVILTGACAKDASRSSS